MSLRNKMFAEFIGTFWLVLGGCGSAVLAAAFPEVGIGLRGRKYAPRWSARTATRRHTAPVNPHCAVCAATHPASVLQRPCGARH